MNQRSEHLSDAQIEDYGDFASGAGPDIEGEVETHLAECPSCRNRLLDFQRTRMGLFPGAKPVASGFAAPSARSELNVSDLHADQNVNTDSTSDCPSESDIRDLAAALLPEARAAELTQHASTCDRCGALLRMYTEDLSDEFTKEEQATLAALGSASADWHQQTAREMVKAGGVGSAATVVAASRPRRISGTSSALVAPSGRRSSFWKWALMPAAAAVCALVAFGVWYRYVRDTPEKVEKLLAQAYTEKRPMEMRWPGAEYAEFRQTRSDESASLLNSPTALRDAADRIAGQLKKSPDNARWQMLSARLDLQDGHYRSALSTLDKIDDANAVKSTDYQFTRALALYEKAEAGPNGSQLYGEAIDLLGKVLQNNPSDSVALFNQALACEKIPAYECALSDWERLIKLEGNSPWSEEAKEHVARIREKKTLDR